MPRGVFKYPPLEKHIMVPVCCAHVADDAMSGHPAKSAITVVAYNDRTALVRHAHGPQRHQASEATTKTAHRTTPQAR